MEENNKLKKLLKNSKNYEVPETKDMVGSTAPNLVTKGETDPNSVIVDIRSKRPIVVFYGPRSIGKTVALIRLSKFLKNEKFSVVPDKNFRKEDERYQKLCDSFENDYISSSIAPSGTAAIDFLLLKIGNTHGDYCQLLEAPGEHYFDPTQPNLFYPPYLETIFSSATPKVYIFFLELNWGTQVEKSNYEKKIVNLLPRVKQSDHIILLCNKSDRKTEFMHNGKPQKKDFKRAIEEEYSVIFDKLGRKGLRRFFSPEMYKYDFVVFTAGSFIERADGSGQTYTVGDNYYPQQLWKAINGGIKGKWF